MTTDKALDLQNILLNHCRQEGAAVNVFLIKGVRLQGAVSGFDPFVLTLRRDGRDQLVYKHGIATLSMALGDEVIPELASGGEGLQQAYLDRLSGAQTEVFLMSGVRLSGRLIAHDRYTLALRTPDGALQLVYKHALSSLSGARS